jgi:hypothetical protein
VPCASPIEDIVFTSHSALPEADFGILTVRPSLCDIGPAHPGGPFPLSQVEIELADSDGAILLDSDGKALGEFL